MDEKNLPIRFFSMRDNDERKTEGAGDSDIPNWVDRDAIPQKQTLFISAMNGMAAWQKDIERILLISLTIKVLSTLSVLLAKTK